MHINSPRLINLAKPALFGGMLALLLQLTGCAPTAPRPSTVEAPPSEEGERISPAARLREYDAKAAAAATPDQRAYYQLLAMELLIEYGKADEVRKRLDEINTRALDKNHHYRIDLLQAQLALAADNVPLALQKLPKISNEYPLPIQAAVLRTRAIALAKLGYLHESLKVRLELDKVLLKLPEKNQARRSNHGVIWSILQATPTDALQSLPVKEDPILLGWVELALNIRAALESGLNRDLAVNNWLSRFPRHPATETLAKTLLGRHDFVSEYPDKLALLLPLSGRYAPQAKAIRDGFLTAYFGHDKPTRPAVRIYDTGSDPERAWQAYQQASQDGAELIVGPLQKDSVSKVVRERNIRVPVLALNYANDEDSYSPNVVQFGLLPEDEARQAAELAIIKNQTRATIFAPNNAYGTRLANAFAERYAELGGRVLTTEKYSAESDDHGHPIQRALNISQSTTRDSILRAVLKAGTKFEPRRREDVQAIFLVASPQQARNFRTQLKYYNSGDVSVYATSQAYTGIANPEIDRDSDGIVFTDMPWVLQGQANSNFAAVARHWPRDLQRFPRLYALGLDAYRIIPYLARLHGNPYERFPGLTGNIALDTGNRIHRELLWATFIDGRAQILEFASVEDHQLYDPESDMSYLQSRE